jgi:hypothetical protein
MHQNSYTMCTFLNLSLTFRIIFLHTLTTYVMLRFAVLTFGWVKTSRLGQDNVGTVKQLLIAWQRTIPPCMYLNLSQDPGDGDRELLWNNGTSVPTYMKYSLRRLVSSKYVAFIMELSQRFFRISISRILYPLWIMTVLLVPVNHKHQDYCMMMHFVTNILTRTSMLRYKSIFHSA